MDIEAIVALEPDLVYVFYDRFNGDLERAGLKVLYIKSLSHGFTDLSDQIRMWGAITGASEEANRVADDFDARVARHPGAAGRRRTEPGPSTPTASSWWTPGRNTLINDVFELAQAPEHRRLRGIPADQPRGGGGRRSRLSSMARPVATVITENPALAGLHMVEDPDHIDHHIFVT